MSKHSEKTAIIPLNEIRVTERIRKDQGDIAELARNIREHGLLQPIVVMEGEGDRYVLIAGLRRLEACRSLGDADIRATVLSPMDADEALMLEISENEKRKDFTTSERLEYADKIKAVEQEKARLRRMRFSDEKRRELEVGNCPPQESEGKVRDIVAEKAGFSSSRQMNRAATVAKNRPDLLDKIDRGETTISGAYQEATRTDAEPAEARPIAGTVMHRGAPIHVATPLPDAPEMFEHIADLVKFAGDGFLANIETAMRLYTGGMASDANSEAIVALLDGIASQAEQIVENRLKEMENE